MKYKFKIALINKIKFWQKHLNWFIPFVSELYPLTKFQLLQYEELWDWNRIKSNPFIKWTEETKICFNDRLQNAQKIDHVLFEVDDMPVIINYPSADEVYFREDVKVSGHLTYWRRIDFGIYIVPEPYDEEILMLLLRKFDCGIELQRDPFGGLPMPTSFIEERKDTLEWDILSRYWGLFWSFELLQRFENYWVTEKLIENHTAFNYCLKDNLDDEFIEKVLHKK